MMVRSDSERVNLNPGTFEWPIRELFRANRVNGALESLSLITIAKLVSRRTGSQAKQEGRKEGNGMRVLDRDYSVIHTAKPRGLSLHLPPLLESFVM